MEQIGRAILPQQSYPAINAASLAAVRVAEGQAMQRATQSRVSSPSGVAALNQA